MAPHVHKFRTKMPYKAAIFAAIEALKDHHPGSSVDAMKKHAQASFPPEIKWNNALFLKALKDGVEKGDLIHVEKCYELSPALKKKRAEEIKEQIEHKKKSSVTPKQILPVKEAPKKKKEVAKRKLSSPKIIAVVKEGRKTEKMELAAEPEAPKPDKKETPKKKIVPSKTKIVPKKLIQKSLIRNPMETI